MKPECWMCIFYIPVCMNRMELIHFAQQYTKNRITWDQKCEELYRELSDDDGVCMVHKIIVASEQKACRCFVSFTKAKIKLQAIIGGWRKNEFCLEKSRRD